MKYIYSLIGALLASSFCILPLKAADANVLSVVNISTPDKAGYAIYWPSGQGNVNLERSEAGGSWINAVATDKNFYVDYDVKVKTEYSYRVGNLVATSSNESDGKSIISGITVESGAVSKSEASVIITFKTDKLAKSQIFYGETIVYDQKSELSNALNQTHTILVEKLKPSSNYHFKIKTHDKSDLSTSESDDQTFTTPKPPTDLSILEVIVRALSSAFSGFEKWLNS